MSEKRLLRLVKHVVKSTERLAKELNNKDTVADLDDMTKLKAAQGLMSVHGYLEVVLGLKKPEETEETKEDGDTKQQS